MIELLVAAQIWVQEIHTWSDDWSLMKVGNQAELSVYPQNSFKDEQGCRDNATLKMQKYHGYFEGTKVERSLHSHTYCILIDRPEKGYPEESPFQELWSTSLYHSMMNPVAGEPV